MSMTRPATLSALAVPVVDFGGRVLAALNASGHAERVDIPTLRERFLPVLREAAANLRVALA